MTEPSERLNLEVADDDYWHQAWADVREQGVVGELINFRASGERMTENLPKAERRAEIRRELEEARLECEATGHNFSVLTDANSGLPYRKPEFNPSTRLHEPNAVYCPDCEQIWSVEDE